MANPKTITSANAKFALAIPGLIPAPVQLQGFSADDIFDTEALEAGEVVMGVDGKLSAGFVYASLKQTISLQADSDSNVFFETLWYAERAASDKFFLFGTIILTSINRSYALSKGALTSYPALPDAKKTLAPRRYVIQWESINAAPI